MMLRDIARDLVRVSVIVFVFAACQATALVVTAAALVSMLGHDHYLVTGSVGVGAANLIGVGLFCVLYGVYEFRRV